MKGERDLYNRRTSLPDGLEEVVLMAGFGPESVREDVNRARDMASDPGEFVVLASGYLRELQKQCGELLARLDRYAIGEVGT